MKKLEKLKIEYVGFSKPETEDEVLMEMEGLKTAIHGAKQRLAMLRQSLIVNKMMKESVVNNEKTVETPDSAVENKQA